MLDEGDMQNLEQELTALRAMAQSGQLDEHRTFQALDRTEHMLQRAAGTPAEETLKVIHCLLSSVWSNVRNIDELRNAASDL